METIEIVRCESSQEANSVKRVLANAGIMSFITNENLANMLPHHSALSGGGIQVMINASDYDEAFELLGLAAHRGNVIVCPHCQSKDVRFGSPSQLITFFQILFISIFFWMPHNTLRNKYFCLNCKKVFKI